MTTEKGKTKIRWTESEKLVVLREAIRLRWSSPYMNWTPALKAAQKKLPEHRRRPEASLENAASGLQKEAQEMRTKGTHIEPTPEQYVEAEEIAVEVPVEEVVQHAVEALAPTDLLQTAIENLAQSACDLIIPRFKEQLITLLRGAALEVVQNIAPEELVVEFSKERAPEKKRKPRVVIVGMIRQQITSLTQEYGEVFDLTFHQASENYKLVQGRVSNADHVLINTTKIDHSLFHTIKKHTDKHISVPGDLSAMRLRLNMLKVEHNIA